MNRRLLVPLTALSLILGACASDEPSDAGSITTQLAPPPTTLAPTDTAAPATSTTSTTSTIASTISSTVTATGSPSIATTSTGVEVATTTVAPAGDAAVESLVLSAEGIGSAAFGADPDTVVSYVSSLLGEPTNDTGWIDPLSVGACPGTEIRFVDWGTLSLVFGDASQIAENRRHFVAYYYGSAGEVGGAPAGLVTDAGITTGSRVVDVKAAYPGATLNPEDDFTSPFFYVSDNMRGYLTGLDDDSTVTVILGGMGCSE
ncbi:MAG: hypothetical protein ABWZ42_06555 [Ilumatobacteraceae bacterium]